MWLLNFYLLSEWENLFYFISIEKTTEQFFSIAHEVHELLFFQVEDSDTESKVFIQNP